MTTPQIKKLIPKVRPMQEWGAHTPGGGLKEGIRVTYFSHYPNAQLVEEVQQFFILGLLRYPQ